VVRRLHTHIPSGLLDPPLGNRSKVLRRPYRVRRVSLGTEGV
jgi:hypothetical protein